MIGQFTHSGFTGSSGIVASVVFGNNKNVLIHGACCVGKASTSDHHVVIYFRNTAGDDKMPLAYWYSSNTSNCARYGGHGCGKLPLVDCYAIDVYTSVDSSQTGAVVVYETFGHGYWLKVR